MPRVPCRECSGRYSFRATFATSDSLRNAQEFRQTPQEFPGLYAPNRMPQTGRRARFETDFSRQTAACPQYSRSGACGEGRGTPVSQPLTKKPITAISRILAPGFPCWIPPASHPATWRRCSGSRCGISGRHHRGQSNWGAPHALLP